MSVKEKLSTLWIVVMLNMVFADIYSIWVELATEHTPDLPGDVRTIMAVAAVATNIPIMMILLSRILEHKVNRMANIIAGILTTIYIVGGASSDPHYIIAAAVEVACISGIVWTAWRWNEEEATP